MAPAACILGQRRRDAGATIARMKTRLLLVVALLAPLPFLSAFDGPAAKDGKAPARQEQVYDEAADAKAQIEAAVARAKSENKRVLVQWGANWCGWCKLLHATLKKDSGLARKLMYEYEVVRVDVGRFDKNTELAKSLGVELASIPRLTVLDGDGKAIAQSDTGEFETKDPAGHDAKKLLAFLETHQAKALEAEAVRAAAFERAAKEGKRVFLHFGAPWCGWCGKLERWMAQPDVAPILAKDFVDLKIDTDRMVGGGDMAKQLRAKAGAKDGGIPWFVLQAGDGAILATSDAKDGNIGFPVKDDEIAHFVGMLKAARRNLSDEDLETLRKSLVASREADEKKRAEAKTEGR